MVLINEGDLQEMNFPVSPLQGRRRLVILLFIVVVFRDDVFYRLFYFMKPSSLAGAEMSIRYFLALAVWVYPLLHSVKAMYKTINLNNHL